MTRKRFQKLLMSKGVSPKVFRDWKIHAPPCSYFDKEFAIDVLNGFDIWSYKGCWDFYCNIALVNCRECCTTEKEAAELAFRLTI